MLTSRAGTAHHSPLGVDPPRHRLFEKRTVVHARRRPGGAYPAAHLSYELVRVCNKWKRHVVLLQRKWPDSCS